VPGASSSRKTPSMRSERLPASPAGNRTASSRKSLTGRKKTAAVAEDDDYADDVFTESGRRDSLAGLELVKIDWPSAPRSRDPGSQAKEVQRRRSAVKQRKRPREVSHRYYTFGISGSDCIAKFNSGCKQYLSKGLPFFTEP
jgi:hypothetical protein